MRTGFLRKPVVNLPTTKILEKVDRCGTMSGRDVDKFAEVGLTPILASKVKPPLIAECPINLECKVIRIFVCLVVINAIGSGSINESKANDEEIGDHDMFTRFTNAKGLWFVGEVIAEHVAKKFLMNADAFKWKN